MQTIIRAHHTLGVTFTFEEGEYLSVDRPYGDAKPGVAHRLSFTVDLTQPLPQAVERARFSFLGFYLKSDGTPGKSPMNGSFARWAQVTDEQAREDLKAALTNAYRDAHRRGILIETQTETGD